MDTKFSKSFVTWFFPVGDDIRAVVADWVAHLRTEKLWGLDDPLFPATMVAVGDNLRFEAIGLDRKHWSNAGPIRKIFKEAFASSGLPTHSAQLPENAGVARWGALPYPPEQYKAWSQNLGHEHVLTTFTSYGNVSSYRQSRNHSQHGLIIRIFPLTSPAVSQVSELAKSARKSRCSAGYARALEDPLELGVKTRSSLGRLVGSL